MAVYPPSHRAPGMVLHYHDTVSSIRVGPVTRPVEPETGTASRRLHGCIGRYRLTVDSRTEVHDG